MSEPSQPVPDQAGGDGSVGNEMVEGVECNTANQNNPAEPAATGLHEPVQPSTEAVRSSSDEAEPAAVANAPASDVAAPTTVAEGAAPPPATTEQLGSGGISMLSGHDTGNPFDDDDDVETLDTAANANETSPVHPVPPSLLLNEQADGEQDQVDVNRSDVNGSLFSSDDEENVVGRNSKLELIKDTNSSPAINALQNLQNSSAQQQQYQQQNQPLSAPGTPLIQKDQIFDAAAKAFNDLSSKFSNPFQELRAKADTEAAAQNAQWAAERRNLFNMMKLSVKRLIEATACVGRPVDESNILLRQFFIVIEQVLRHGNKGRKMIIGPKKELWGPLEALEKVLPLSNTLVANVRALPNIRTPLGRGRAWLRLALMEKQLGEYVRILIETGIAAEWFEPWASIRSDEGAIMPGILRGLGSIDFNLVIKGDALDSMSDVIDMSLYLREGNHLVQAPEESASSDSLVPVSATAVGSPMASPSKPRLISTGSINSGNEVVGSPPTSAAVATAAASNASILASNQLYEQKTYLEELNRNLNSQITDLNRKLEHLERNVVVSEERAQSLTRQLELIREERDRAKEELRKSKEAFEIRSKMQSQDLSLERETYKKTSQDLDLMYMMVKKQLDNEIRNRGELEKQILNLQEQLHESESEANRLKLLDTDRQDHVDALRKQLDAVKMLNIAISNDLQASKESMSKEKELQLEQQEELDRLKLKNQLLQTRLDSVEGNAAKVEQARQNTDQQAREIRTRLVEAEKELVDLRTELMIQKEWRQTMTADREKDMKQIDRLNQRIREYELVERELENSRAEVIHLKNVLMSHEKMLEDMGNQLNQSALRIEDLNKLKKDLRSHEWEDEKLVTDCRKCRQAFSLTRRKHHCRNCGKIFCQECSDNRISLPSSAKPVRVCDACQTLFLGAATA